MKMLWVTLTALVLVACGGTADNAEPDAAEEEEARGGVIGEGYVDAMDKAEAVEDLAIERKEAIDDATDTPE